MPTQKKGNFLPVEKLNQLKADLAEGKLKNIEVEKKYGISSATVSYHKANLKRKGALKKLGVNPSKTKAKSKSKVKAAALRKDKPVLVTQQIEPARASQAKGVQLVVDGIEFNFDSSVKNVSLNNGRLEVKTR